VLKDTENDLMVMNNEVLSDGSVVVTIIRAISRPVLLFDTGGAVTPLSLAVGLRAQNYYDCSVLRHVVT